MDLHAWITQQVDRAELTGRRIALVPDDGSHAIHGIVTDVSHGSDGLNFSVAQHGAEPTADAALLRRCEADRRILARHRAWPQSPYCEGCDQDLTTNLNDCPELLDLAHAHGITPDVLAGLDRPQAPKGPTLLDVFAQRLNSPEYAHVEVPPSLRGPNWQPRT